MSETLHTGAGTSRIADIDPRAVVSPSARLAPGVRIGAYAVVSDNVELGEGTVLHPHAVVHGPTSLGKANVLHPFCVVGGDPQDLKYQGETTRLEVGNGNVFREGVTVNRGTGKGGGLTRIGNDNFFMTDAHVAHDCIVGNRTIFANSATLAGHVVVADHATVGAFAAVHQFCRVGRFAYIGGYTVVTQDVAPFCSVVTERDTHCYGVNTVGLERNGFSAERIRVIESAYRLLLRSKLNTTQAVEQMRATLNGSAEVGELIAFIESAARGLVK